MREQLNVRQIPGEPRRRWFSSKDFDLIVWLDDDQRISGFELCYDKQHREHALVWNRASGFRHMAVDDGEQRPGKYKATPILVADGLFDGRRIHAAFREASRALPSEISETVLRALEQHPQFSG
ncbi:MAG TPA: hypothetical protein VFR06_00255 [Gallionellaceae bacterium]|nr:hypothetical protein [Gallionellaceae bacterium]